MNQLDISQQLGNLINQTSGVYTTIPADEVIPSELEQPEPIFEIDHESEQNKKKQLALLTVGFIMKSVIPSKYHNDEMIQNKMRLDADLLGMLYYNLLTNDKTLLSAIDLIAKGDTLPRMYEIVDKLEKRATDISNLITDLLNLLRKYYIDTYLDILLREAADEYEDDIFEDKKLVSSKNEELKKIELKTDDGSVIITSPEDLKKRLDEIRILRAKTNKIKDADFEEVEK